MRMRHFSVALALSGALVCFAQFQSVQAQWYDPTDWFDNRDGNTPYDDTVYNEDEWYDPTDWFDANNYEYDDTLGLDYSYDYDYDYDYESDLGDVDFNDDWGWEDDLGHDYDRWGENLYDNDLDFENRDTRRNRAAAGSARNQTTGQGRAGATGERSSAKMGQERQRQTRVISGDVESTRLFTLTDWQGRNMRHTIAEVQLEDGRDVLVDLGPYRTGRQMNISEGDRLVARGRTGTINQRRVLLADRIQLNGESYNIRRDTAQRSPVRSLSGRVETFRSVQLRDGGQRTFATLRLQNGQSAIVDLGPDIRVSELDINRNEWITVRGRQTSVNGRQVLRVDHLWVNGEPHMYESAYRQQ